MVAPTCGASASRVRTGMLSELHQGLEPDDVLLRAAQVMAASARCERRQVGAVIVAADGSIAGVGYNGSPEGYPGCGSCPRRLSSCESGATDRATSYDVGPTACFAVHAEVRAILAADRRDCVGGTLVVSIRPCLPCELVAREAGLARVIWPEGELKWEPTAAAS